MGWFPARDKDNRVPPELLNWPQTGALSGKAWVGGSLFVRARQFGVGMSRDGKYDKKSDQKLLSQHAQKFGYHNGVKLHKGGANGPH